MNFATLRFLVISPVLTIFIYMLPGCMDGDPTTSPSSANSVDPNGNPGQPAKEGAGSSSVDSAAPAEINNDGQVADPSSDSTQVDPEIGPTSWVDADDNDFQPSVPLMLVQIRYNLVRIQEALESEDDYNDLSDRMKNDAATVASLAIALGLSPVDEGNLCKPIAGEVANTCLTLSQSKTYEEACQAFEDVKNAFRGTYAEKSPIEWSTAATVESWLAHSALCNKLDRAIKRFETKAENIAEMSMVLAVLANVARFEKTISVDEAQRKIWIDHCIAMRNGMLAVSQAAQSGEGDKVEAAVTQMKTKTCDTCHEVFNPE